MSGAETPPPTIVRLIREPIAVEATLDEIASPRCGAVATFLGVVRDHHRGRGVRHLDYSAYEPMALSEMQRIADALLEREGIERVALVHRLGHLEVGEASILIGLALPHRAEAFDALRFAIDTFKETVPIWKQETFEDGSVEWIEGS